MEYIVKSLQRMYGFVIGEGRYFEKISVPRRGKTLSPLSDFSHYGQIQSLIPMQPSSEFIFSIDDTEARTKIWEMFFGEAPIPKLENHAVDKYYGVLDRFVAKKKLSRKKIERILEEL
jgi:hypothetical protein